MQALILTLHIIACLILVVLVLLQSGQEGMGVIFGGGSGSMFGGGGAGGLLTKLTAGVATVFLLTSLSYNYLNTERMPQDSSVMDIQLEEQLDRSQPEAPAPAEESSESEGGVSIEESAPAQPDQPGDVSQAPEDQTQ